ncbi:hypothetical protein, partial [Lactiplantibacillus plantarum]|uniref:hypothetical protein n=1 Tax=Lactiplantibacillus plantarum TaxID=1590 RepID=UPI00218242F0
LNIIREGIPYFYTIQKSFMHLHKIFYALKKHESINNIPERMKSTVGFIAIIGAQIFNIVQNDFQVNVKIMITKIKLITLAIELL